MLNLSMLVVLAAGCRSGASGEYRPFLRHDDASLRVLPVTHVAQQDARSCGAACLEMVLRYWGRPVGQGRIHAQTDRGDPRGVAAKDLKRFAQSRGFDVFIVRGSPADLFWHLEKGIPLIAARRKRYGGALGNHYVVVTGCSADKDELIVDDPARGPVRVRLERFLADWSQAQRFLMVVVPKAGAGQRGRAGEGSQDRSR